MRIEFLLESVSVYTNSLILVSVVLLVLRIIAHTSAALKHQLLIGLYVSLSFLPLLHLFVPTTQLLPIPQLTVTEIQLTAQDSPRVGSPEWKANRDQRLLDKSRKPADTGAFDRLGEKVLSKANSAFSFSGEISDGSLVGLPFIFLGLWVVGFLTVLIVQLTRWAGAGFIAEMATDFEIQSSANDVQEPLVTTLTRLCREQGLTFQVRILQSEIAAIAMVWGVRNPCIVLPADATRWSALKLEGVLRHEVSHIKRRDNLLQILIISVCAFYWANPLVWIALRQLHFEREVACDDTVLRSGTNPSTYAKHLMEIAMKLNGPKSERIVPAIMAHSSDIKRRLVQVLNPDVNRRPLGIAQAIACLFFIVILAFPISSLRIWRGPVVMSDAHAARRSEGRVSVLGSRTDTQSDLFFNGSDSHVIIPDADVFDFSGDFTLEASVNVADLGQSGQNLIILSKHRSHVNDSGEWAWYIMGPPNPIGRIQFSVWSGGSSYTAVSADGVVQASAEHCSDWQDLAFSYSAGTGAWHIFINGQVVGSGIGILDIGQTDRDLWIGWESNEPNHDFNGWVRELRISDSYRYDGPYDHETPLQADAATVAYWDFNEGSGSILDDVSGNGHDGTIINASWDICLGDVIEVEPGTNLQSVVDAAPDGSEIILLPGIHTGPVVFSGRDLSLCGSGVDMTILDANFYDYAVLVSDGGNLNLCELKIINCFNDNPVEYYYPAALTVDDGDVEVIHCLFENNLNAVGAWRSGSHVQITESTLLVDTAVGFMTREADASTEISADNCTILGNRDDLGHGLVKMWGGSMVVSKCVLSQPTGRAIEYHSGIWSGDCNIIYAELQVGGSLVLPANHWNVDPRLCNLDGWSYRVFPESPAIPANNDCGVQIGSGGVCGTSIKGTSWSSLKKLY